MKNAPKLNSDQYWRLVRKYASRDSQFVAWAGLLTKIGILALAGFVLAWILWGLKAWGLEAVAGEVQQVVKLDSRSSKVELRLIRSNGQSGTGSFLIDPLDAELYPKQRRLSLYAKPGPEGHFSDLNSVYPRQPNSYLHIAPLLLFGSALVLCWAGYRRDIKGRVELLLQGRPTKARIESIVTATRRRPKDRTSARYRFIIWRTSDGRCQGESAEIKAVEAERFQPEQEIIIFVDPKDPTRGEFDVYGALGGFESRVGD